MQTEPSNLKQGFSWIRQSFTLFGQSPAKWFLLALAYVTFYMVLPSLPALPLLLKILIGLSWPMFVVLAIALFRETDLQREAKLADIIQQIRPHAGKLLALGGLCLLYGVVVSFFTQDDLQALPAITEIQAMPEGDVGASMMFMLKLALLLTPMLMATWFSPMLIVFNGYSLGKAIKSSIAGCLQFLLALGAAWLLLTMLITLGMMLIGLVIGLLAAFSQALGLSLITLLLFSSLFMATALMLAFQYVSYRDIFRMAAVQPA